MARWDEEEVTEEKTSKNYFTILQYYQLIIRGGYWRRRPWEVGYHGNRNNPRRPWDRTWRRERDMDEFVVKTGKNFFEGV